MQLHLIAMQAGHFRPAASDDEEKIRRHWKPGELAILEVRKPRNGKFHRKYFALINFLFEYWEPAIKEHRGMTVQKNLDKFREDLTIAAGFHETYVNAITGELRLKAKSIAFANMDENEFEKLYSAVINIGLEKILPESFDDDEVRNAVANELLGYA